MANELTVNATLQYAKGQITAETLSVASKSFNVAGSNMIKATQLIPTTAGGTTILLGGLGSVGWAFFKNNDLTNIIRLMTLISTGVAFCDLQPGEFAEFRFAATITAPAAISLVASCQLEYMIVEI